MNTTVHLNALDHHFAEFITSIDSTPGDGLWLAAALVSAATGKGSVCLDLAEAAGIEVVPFRPSPEPLRAPDAERWFKSLAGCTTVGRPGDYTPLVLDDAGRLYLYRSWDYECRVADGVLARVGLRPIDQERLRSGLDRFFPPVITTPDWQRAATVAAVSRSLTVISGGPGTGKTTTVARILALLLEQPTGHDLRIALAAPTGKAAMRLRQSILQATRQLDLPDEIRARIPDGVQTIHRLLGVLPGAAVYRHNRDNPLPVDVLVVDEVSMVDLPLMARLLEALSPDARLILLGDRDQLASVEAGAVLADICNHGLNSDLSSRPDGFQLSPKIDTEQQVATLAPLADAVIQLRTSYRFGETSGIGKLSRLINAGDGTSALELLMSGEHSDLIWHPLPPANNFEAAFSAAVRSAYDTYVRSTTPESALEELECFRVLSPHREGIYGVNNLNRLALSALGLRLASGQSCCRLLPVMVTGNNYELGLFNGDTAVILDDASDNRLTAFFSNPEGGLRRLSPLRLPPFDPAFALTVHKSQGSEFERVLLILPERMSKVLSRELLYTAVTRARTKVEIWGAEEVFRQAVERRIIRSSGLRDRLWSTTGRSREYSE